MHTYTHEKKAYNFLLTGCLGLQEFDAYIQNALINPEHSPQQRRQLLAHWEEVRLCNLNDHTAWSPLLVFAP